MTEETGFDGLPVKKFTEDRADLLDKTSAHRPDPRTADDPSPATEPGSAAGEDARIPPAAPTVDLVAGAPEPSPTKEFVPTKIDTPFSNPAGTDRPAVPPELVIAGRYHLEVKIGEGGMGEVWVARQTAPVKRRVALKLIKAGMDSSAVLARFEQERQALALMDHPNIARVLDAGATPLGRPFFVMDLVDGPSLTRFCDEARLTLRQRLELFVPICQAVQHAHQKGIVHRDLKPANILVARVDGKPTPKVIDFGVAKATGGNLTDDSMATQMGVVVGTFEYMSPEQAGLTDIDVDTRADIYSLGVVLYELLTGLRPIDAARLKKAALNEMIRIIREEEPSKPSTRLSTNLELNALAALRQTPPKKLTSSLRGELDWIVMKCLEKSRERRYETANALGRDIARYLADEPVEARPPSSWYRLSKFLRRNRGPVAAGIAVAAALLVGSVGFAWQAHVAQTERDAAQTERDRAVAAETAIQKQADDLQRVSDFQAAMLRQIDPTEAGKLLSADVRLKLEAALVKAGGTEAERAEQTAAFAKLWDRVNATDAARDFIDGAILKPAAAAIDKQFVDQPALDAALRQTLADRYREMGMYDAALPLLERALATRRRVLGDDDLKTLTSINDLGILYYNQGKMAEAERYYREALEKRRRVLGPDHERTLSTLGALSVLLEKRGDLAEAETHMQEILKLQTAKLGEDDEETLRTMNNLGNVLRERGRYADAEACLRVTVDKMRKTLGEERPETLFAINGLGLTLVMQRKYKEAEPLWREALEKGRRVLGEEHPETFTFLDNLSGLLGDLRKFDDAESYAREALAKRRRVLGEDHYATLTSISNVGNVLRLQGKLPEAEAFHREALEKRRRVLGESHPDTISSIGHLGRILSREGKRDEAEPYYRQFADLKTKSLGRDHPERLTAVSDLGVLLMDQGKFDEAEPLCREALETRIRVLGPDHVQTLVSNNIMGNLFIRQKKLDAAEPFWSKALETSRRVLADDDPELIVFIHNMGTLRRDQGKLDESEKLLSESLVRSEKTYGKEHPTTLTVTSSLAGVWVKQKRYMDVLAKLSPLEPLFRKSFTGSNADMLAKVLLSLGRAHCGLRQFSEAEVNLIEAHEIYLKSRGSLKKSAQDYIEGCVDNYTAWDVAEPGKGYDKKAAEWKEKLEAEKAKPAEGKPNEKK